MPAARTPPFGPPAALALLAGVCACLALPRLPPWGPLAAAAAVGLALWTRPSRARLAGALIAGFGIAGLHAAHALDVRIPDRQQALVTGRIAELPRVEPRRTVFAFDVDEDAGSPVAGRRVRVAWYRDRGPPPPELHAGERWRLPLRLRPPRGLRNPGGPDAEKAALVDRLAATGHVDPRGAERLDAASGMAGWRDAAAARIAAAVPSDTSRFVRALAIGDTRGLDDADWAVLRADGLTHLIAISGFHVGMVAGLAALLVRGLWWAWPALGRRLPARIAAALAGAAVAAIYAAAAGFSLPTVRTLLMIVVVAVAQLARRGIGMPQALALAAVAILLADPLSVLTAGFWLSFVGVVWLLWCLPRGGGSMAGELVKAQGVASIGLLPLTVILFGQASLAGPVANLVAVPWWSLVVAPLSVGGLALDWIHPALADGAWRLAAWCFDLAWPLFLRLGSTPLALWWLPEPHWLALPLALFGAFWLLLPRGVPGKPVALLLWLPLVWPDTHRPAHGAAEVTAIDVGQGLSVLVRTRGHALLYDMGPAVPEGFDAGERAVVPTLRARGIGRLDRMVVSHGDLDHAGGLAAVRRSIPATDLLAPDGSKVDGSRPCLAGTGWDWDGVRFRFLHPTPYFPYLGNEASCVLRIETAGGAVLLTGDIGDIIERRLVAAQPGLVRAEVVFAGHHGSRHSSDPAFVEATRARHVVFSTGHGNRFRHPNGQVVERWEAAGATAWDTAQRGALTIRLGVDGITVSARRDANRRLWDAARRTERGNAGLSYRGD